MNETVVPDRGWQWVLALSVLILTSAVATGEVAHQDSSVAELSRGGDDFRTTQVRQYFERLGREFGVYRLALRAPGDASYTSGTQVYHLDRKRAGNLRYNTLKVSDVAFYRAIAQSINEHFEPLTDTVHNDGSDVSGPEWLQMIYRQAKALTHAKTDLDTVDGRVTVTYAYDGHHLVVAPTTFNFIDNAVNAKGSSLHSKFGVSSFSKHYMLALILNENAEVTMAGKIYTKLTARDPGAKLDLQHVFTVNGEVDLDRYQFEVTVTNESGTFKPLSTGLPVFAQVLVDALDLPRLQFMAHAPAGSDPVTGWVYSSLTGDN